MFEDDATVDSESNQQPPSDAFDWHAAIDSARTLQDVPKSNPETGARGATDFAASLSTDASSVMSSPTDPAALTSPAASTPTAASAISGNQDAPITGAAASGDASPAPAGVGNAGVGNLAALGPTTSTAINATPTALGSTAIANANVSASPDGAASTAPLISGSDHSGHVGMSADQVAPPLSLDPVKQLLEPTPSQAATGSGSTSVASPAITGPTLGPILGGLPDVALLGARPSDGGIAPVHPDGDAKPKALDTLASVAPMTKAAAADAASIPSMVESGANAILLSAHDGTVAAGGAVGVPGPKQGASGAPIIPAPSITPDVLATRDQLASAIATANPTAAAMTTSPAQAAPAPLVPTLGADTHTLHMHGG
jgi:hypothetical protein